MSKKEYMFDLIARWKLSGQTRAEFSRQNEISLKSFYYWCNRYYNETASLTNKQSTSKQISVDFVEIDLLSPSIKKERLAQIEMELPSGLRIKIY